MHVVDLWSPIYLSHSLYIKQLHKLFVIGEGDIYDQVVWELDMNNDGNKWKVSDFGGPENVGFDNENTAIVKGFDCIIYLINLHSYDNHWYIY